MANMPGFITPHNRGPLTTTFIPAPTCLATTTGAVIGLSLPPSEQETRFYVGYWNQDVPNRGGIDSISTDCLPPAQTPIPLAEVWYYSPGICPTGYMPNLALSADHVNNFNAGQDVMVPNATAWLCCPS